MMEGINTETAAKVARRNAKRGGANGSRSISTNGNNHSVTYAKLTESGIRLDKKLGKKANNLSDALSELVEEQELFIVILGGRRSKNKSVYAISQVDMSTWRKLTRNLTPGKNFELYAYPEPIR